jgi:hypothetical protein
MGKIIFEWRIYSLMITDVHAYRVLEEEKLVNKYSLNMIGSYNITLFSFSEMWWKIEEQYDFLIKLVTSSNSFIY